MKYIIVILCVTQSITGYLLFCDYTNNDHKAEKKILLNRIDSIKSTYDSIILKNDREAYLAFKNAEEGRVRWEARAIMSEQNLKNEINKHRTFSDFTTDSLLSKVR